MTDEKLPEPDIESLSDLKELPLDIFVRDNLTPEIAIGLANILFPEFMEYEDCIFMNHEQDKYFRENFKRWHKGLKGDLGAMERVMNHRHIFEDWLPSLYELNHQNKKYFVSVMKNTWLAALNTQFPSYEFEVSSTYDDHTDDYILTFWQPKNGNP